MPMFFHRSIAGLLPLFAVLLALGGCGSLTQTPYSAPQTAAQPRWQHDVADSAQAVDRWWSQFNDAALDALIANVLARNNDLAAAGIKVRRAWLEAGISADGERPALSASANSSNTQKEGGERTQSHTASLNVSYEVDLWGRLASATDAARWAARATEEDRANTAWTLVATTTRLYWKLAYVNTRLTLAQQNVDYALRTLAIARVRHNAGAVSGLDVIEAEQTLASLQATQSAIAQSRVDTGLFSRLASAVLELPSAPVSVIAG